MSLFLPPWKQFCHLNRFDKAYLEAEPFLYLKEWLLFIKNLKDHEFLSYQKTFVEPMTYQGFYHELVQMRQNCSQKDLAEQLTLLMSWSNEDKLKTILKSQDYDALQSQRKSYYVCLEQNDLAIEPLVFSKWRNSVPLFNDEHLKSLLKTNKNTKQFLTFWGHHPKKLGVIDKSCFSQWFLRDFKFGQQNYNCMEQFMMAQKALLFKDFACYQKILKAREPKYIKALGRSVLNFEESKWQEFKYLIVLNGNWAKFSQNLDLAHFLCATDSKILIEASPYDKVWGVAMSYDHPEIYDIDKWRGENLLGRALMEVRFELLRCDF